MKIKQFGKRAGSSQRWSFETSAEIAETFGYQLTIFINVDTANSDTVKIEGSPDGTQWYTIGNYTAEKVGSIPAMPYVKASWSFNSSVQIYGMKMTG